MDSDSRGKLIIKKLIFVRVARQGFVGVEVEVQCVGTVGAEQGHGPRVRVATQYE